MKRWAVLALLALPACGTTLDSLGSDSAANAGSSAAGGAGPSLAALSAPSSYPNTFHDLLGESEAQIQKKLDDAFSQLFYGDASSQAIYVPLGKGSASIADVLHGDVRSEGLGIGMIVTVELDKRAEFDSLWAYAKTTLLIQTGPSRGYYASVCDDADPCVDPYGMQLFLTALLFANDRWGGAGSYAPDARQLLTLFRHDEDTSNGLPDVGIFDPVTHLVREQPLASAAGYTRSSLEMPAMYELWAEASGDPFWTAAATAARAHLTAAASASTGLWPMRSYFDAAPVSGSDSFTPQAYRTQLNLALDTLWGRQSSAETALADRLLGFFTMQGLTTYGTSYTLDGTPIDLSRDLALIAANGALAVAATRSNRTDFVAAVWGMAIPSGPARYYHGVLYLLSLLELSGQYRVY